MRFVLLIVLLLIPARGVAQEPRPVECRFLGFGADDTATVLALDGKGAEIICPLPTTRLSENIVCAAEDRKIAFLSPADRKPLATATVPAGLRSAILVFVRTSRPTDPEAWLIFVIEDSPKGFPDGGAYVANLFSREIRFVIGEHKGMLRAGTAHGYAMPTERDDFNMAPVIFEFRQGENWRTANESALRFLPGMRYLIFAYRDPLSGRPRIKTIQDIEKPAAARP